MDVISKISIDLLKGGVAKQKQEILIETALLSIIWHALFTMFL